MSIEVEYIPVEVVFLPLFGNGGAHREKDGSIHLTWNPEGM